MITIKAGAWVNNQGNQRPELPWESMAQVKQLSTEQENNGAELLFPITGIDCNTAISASTSIIGGTAKREVYIGSKDAILCTAKFTISSYVSGIVQPVLGFFPAHSEDTTINNSDGRMYAEDQSILIAYSLHTFGISPLSFVGNGTVRTLFELPSSVYYLGPGFFRMWNAGVANATMQCDSLRLYATLGTPYAYRSND